MLTILIAQLFWGVNPLTMSTSETISHLAKQGFTEVWKPKPPLANAAVEALAAGVRMELDWIGHYPYDTRLVPPLRERTIRYVELHNCPPSGKIAEIEVAYKDAVSATQFGVMTKRITDSFHVDPVITYSTAGVTVDWLPSKAGKISAFWNKSSAPRFYYWGSSASLDCNLAFGASSIPD